MVAVFTFEIVGSSVYALNRRMKSIHPASVWCDRMFARHEGRALGDEAEDSGHGYATVLDLRMPPPADVRLHRVDAVPGEDCRLREVQRVPVARWARQRILELHEVRLGFCVARCEWI